MDVKTMERIARHVSPAAMRFIEYVAGEFSARAKQSAIEQGFNSLEAEYIANVTAKAAVKAMASATKATLTERRFIQS